MSLISYLFFFYPLFWENSHFDYVDKNNNRPQKCQLKSLSLSLFFCCCNIFLFSDPPTLQKEKKVQFKVEEGESVVLRCNPPASIIPPHIHWMDDSECTAPPDCPVSVSDSAPPDCPVSVSDSAFSLSSVIDLSFGSFMHVHKQPHFMPQ